MTSSPRRGFTLIEQIVTIAVAGTASAVALPALQSLQADADRAALQHLAAAAGSAMAVNFAGCLVTGQQAVPGKCIPVQDCAQVGLLLQAGLPAGYQAPAQALPRAGSGRQASCQLVDDQRGAAAPFRGYGTGLL